jgi:quercetin dioxygenase-like cupin family protein
VLIVSGAQLFDSLRSLSMNRMTRSLQALATLFLFVGASTIVASAQEPPSESKGQKAVELCSLDLTAEMGSGAGRRLRVRVITLDPGGVVAVHSHQDRPTIMHVLEGRVRSVWVGKPDRELGVGDCVAEGKDITHHWMENKGPEPVKYIAIDVTR